MASALCQGSARSSEMIEYRKTRMCRRQDGRKSEVRKRIATFQLDVFFQYSQFLTRMLLKQDIVLVKLIANSSDFLSRKNNSVEHGVKEEGTGLSVDITAQAYLSLSVATMQLMGAFIIESSTFRCNSRFVNYSTL